MPRFLDTHKIGTSIEEQLIELQKSPPDEFGVVHINMLYNYESDTMYCILEAPNEKASLEASRQTFVLYDFIS